MTHSTDKKGETFRCVTIKLPDDRSVTLGRARPHPEDDGDGVGDGKLWYVRFRNEDRKTEFALSDEALECLFYARAKYLLETATTKEQPE